MMDIATLTNDGQLTLPVSVVENLVSASLKEFCVSMDGASIILKPVKNDVPGKEEYKAFMKEAQAYAAANGMKEDAIAAAIRTARARKS